MYSVSDSAASRMPTLLLALAAAVAILFFGPPFLATFRPAPDVYPDFVQEWLSGRNFWSGEPVYSPQRAAMHRHTGQDLTAFDTELPWNAHPPAALLLALPFGLILDFRNAHLAWNLSTFALFLAALVLIARELRLAAAWRIAAAAGAVGLIVSWHAVWSQLFQGQLNFVILALLVVAWSCDRRDRPIAAGAAVGMAAAIKLFPALLLIYFAAVGRWRAVLAAIGVGVLLNLAALLLFGAAAFETYLREDLPGLAVFRASWLNVSLTGYWTRVGIALGVPAVGKSVAMVCQFAVVGLVWLAGRRARNADASGSDRAFALTVIGMVLASPVAWTHYFVLLALPLAVLWYRPPRGAALAALLVASAALWLPERFVPGMIIGTAEAAALTGVDSTPGGAAMAALVLGIFPAALAILFLLLAFAQSARAPLTRSSP